VSEQPQECICESGFGLNLSCPAHSQHEQNVHIEHYFPKGYNPDDEPWKSIKTHHNAATKTELDPREEFLFLQRLRENLNRWQARFAQAKHAADHVKATRLLMQEIDERILALNRDA
jgi:hypothetical protein